MQKPRLYADSSCIIIGMEKKGTNSSSLLELIAAEKLQAFTSEKTLAEVDNHFRDFGGEREAYFSIQFIKRCFTIVLLSKILAQQRRWRGKIKEKDLAHLATAKMLRLPVIVAFDRDFKPFAEYRTPKQFLEEMGAKTFGMEY